MKEVILVGGGKSIREGISLGLWDKLKGHEVWSLNYAFMTMPYLPSKQLWVDKSFFQNNIDKLQELSNQGVHCVAKKNYRISFFEEIEQYQTTTEMKYHKGRTALEVEPKQLYIGGMGLVGAFALSYAIAKHYDIIYLLGYDFGPTSIDDTDTHFYQGQLEVKSSGMGHPRVYFDARGKLKKHIQEWYVFTKDGCKIYNVSLTSNIRCFPKINYEEFFKCLSG